MVELKLMMKKNLKTRKYQTTASTAVLLVCFCLFLFCVFVKHSVFTSTTVCIHSNTQQSPILLGWTESETSCCCCCLWWFLSVLQHCWNKLFYWHQTISHPSIPRFFLQVVWSSAFQLSWNQIQILCRKDWELPELSTLEWREWTPEPGC